MFYFSFWVLFVGHLCKRRIYQSSYFSCPHSQPIPQVSSQYIVSKQNLNFDFTPTAKDSLRSEPIAYICGLRARIECEHGSEHSTRSDRVTNIGYRLASEAVFACGKFEINSLLTSTLLSAIIAFGSLTILNFKFISVEKALTSFRW